MGYGFFWVVRHFTNHKPKELKESFYVLLKLHTSRYAETLTCGDRVLVGWVKSVEWAGDRRPCALLTV